jgi:hypothetical protein
VVSPGPAYNLTGVINTSPARTPRKFNFSFLIKEFINEGTKIRRIELPEMENERKLNS